MKIAVAKEVEVGERRVAIVPDTVARLLIISGALAGASGIILTQIMCKAMNRSITNVLFSALTKTKTAVSGAIGATATDKVVKSIDPEEGAMMLGYARSVVIIPGYGMAVAQAQHAVRELADQLERLGVDVKYAIHPVAGRMQTMSSTPPPVTIRQARFLECRYWKSIERSTRS